MASLSDLYSYAPSEVMAMLFPETSAYRPDLPQAMKRGTYDNPRQFIRHSGMEPKGFGYLGPMKAKSSSEMTEFSMGDKYGDFSSLVPTLKAEELAYLLSEPQSLPSIPSKARVLDDSVYNKAKSFAGLRRLQGLSPFYD